MNWIELNILRYETNYLSSRMFNNFLQLTTSRYVNGLFSLLDTLELSIFGILCSWIIVCKICNCSNDNNYFSACSIVLKLNNTYHKSRPFDMQGGGACMVDFLLLGFFLPSLRGGYFYSLITLYGDANPMVWKTTTM